MKDEKKKKINSEINLNQSKKKISPRHLEEQENLFSKADEISPVNKPINKTELVKLNNGDEFLLSEYVAENYSKPSPHFTKEGFYFPLAELFGIDKKEMENFRKPHFVPIFKNNYILARFPQKVINRIKEKNKYVSYCRREYFHYQVLTKSADEKYKLFIWQAQEIIKKANSLKQFIQEYCTMYNLPIQLDLFDNLLSSQ